MKIWQRVVDWEPGDWPELKRILIELAGDKKVADESPPPEKE